MSFSGTLLDHFQMPRNNGELADADGEAQEENPACGDRLRLQVRVHSGRIEAVAWQAEGCAPAIAAASMASEMIRGRTVEEARGLTAAEVTEALGGLPPRKGHAAQLATMVIRRALAGL